MERLALWHSAHVCTDPQKLSAQRGPRLVLVSNPTVFSVSLESDAFCLSAPSSNGSCSPVKTGLLVTFTDSLVSISLDPEESLPDLCPQKDKKPTAR